MGASREIGPASSREVAAKLMALAWPMMLSSVLMYLDSANMRFWLGRYLGKEGLAVHAATAPLLGLVNLLFMGIGTGCGVAVARSIGARDGRGLSIAASALALVGAMWLAVVAVFVPFATPISELLAEDGLSPVHLRRFIVPWIILAQPLFAVISVLISTVSSAGWTRFVLRQGTVHLALTVTFMPLFLGPLDLGYAGVSLALSLATAVNCVLLWRMLRPQAEARFLSARIDRSMILRRSLWRQILDVGLPMQLSRVGAFVVAMAVVIEVRGAGVAALAGWGIALAYVEIGGALSGGFSAASQILIAQRLGAEDPAGARHGLSIALRIGVGFPVVFTTALFVLARPAVRVFTDNPEVIASGVTCIRLLVWVLYPAAIWHVLLSAFGAARATKRIFLLTLAAQALAFTFVVSWTGDPIPGGALAMLAMFGLSAGFCFVLSVPVLWRGALRAPTT